MRGHFWMWLCNEEGQPIPSANISIYAGNPGPLAWIFHEEEGGTPTQEAPQCVTDDYGYFEFWIGIYHVD